MTFDLTCKVFEILDSKEDSSHGGKVLRVQDGTRSQLPLLSVAGMSVLPIQPLRESGAIHITRDTQEGGRCVCQK